MSPTDDAVEGYELALERAKLARLVWKKAGQPLTLVQPNGTEGKHPLWSALLDAEAFLIRSRAALGSAKRGRPAGASSAPDRQAPARLKVVAS